MSEEPFPKWPALHHSNSKVDFNDLETLKKATAQEVRQHCRDNLGRHDVPRQVHLIPQLPKNAAGNVLNANCGNLANTRAHTRQINEHRSV